MVTVLFYKAAGTWRDTLIRTLTGSIYSHCELVAPGQTGPVFDTIAASKRDGHMVRKGRIDTRTGHWDVLTYHGDPDAVWARAEALVGLPYDVGGAILSATALARHTDGHWFCSNLIAHALGFCEPWEFSPGMLAAASNRPMQYGFQRT